VLLRITFSNATRKSWVVLQSWKTTSFSVSSPPLGRIAGVLHWGRVGFCGEVWQRELEAVKFYYSMAKVQLRLCSLNQRFSAWVLQSKKLWKQVDDLLLMDWCWSRTSKRWLHTNVRTSFGPKTFDQVPAFHDGLGSARWGYASLCPFWWSLWRWLFPAS
jgi:hypothetical protein